MDQKMMENINNIPKYEFAIQRCVYSSEFHGITTPDWFPFHSTDPELKGLSEDTLAHIKKGLEDVRNKKTVPAKEVWQRLGL